MYPSGKETDHGWTFTTIVAQADGTVVLRVTPTRTVVPCPMCGVLSRRQHSWYTRRAMDLPWRGATVRLRVRSRRWFCDEPGCPRRIFAERFEGLLACGARRSNEATSLLTELGRSYATVLIDMERHEPIDVLATRDADPLVEWLRAHPGIEVIVRDRGGAYADAARRGAPNALQVADRFHLVQNVGAAEHCMPKASRCGPLACSLASTGRPFARSSARRRRPAISDDCRARLD